MPERAGREGQPLPTAGEADVLQDLARTLPVELATRRDLGVRRYGRSLQTWNGRDVGRDLQDELLDALAYARQGQLEREDLERALLVLARFARGDKCGGEKVASALDLAERVEKLHA